MAPSVSKLPLTLLTSTGIGTKIGAGTRSVSEEVVVVVTVTRIELGGCVTVTVMGISVLLIDRDESSAVSE